MIPLKLDSGKEVFLFTMGTLKSTFRESPAVVLIDQPVRAAVPFTDHSIGAIVLKMDLPSRHNCLFQYVKIHPFPLRVASPA